MPVTASARCRNAGETGVARRLGAPAEAEIASLFALTGEPWFGAHVRDHGMAARQRHDVAALIVDGGIYEFEPFTKPSDRE